MPRKLIHLLWQWLLCGFQQRAQCQHRRHPDTAQFAVRRQEAGQSEKVKPQAKCGQRGNPRKKKRGKEKKIWETLLGRFTMPRHVNIWRHLYKKKKESWSGVSLSKQLSRRCQQRQPIPLRPRLHLYPYLDLRLRLRLCLTWSRRNRDKVHNISLDFLRGICRIPNCHYDGQFVCALSRERVSGQEEEIGMNRAKTRLTHSWKRKVKSGSRE